MQTSWRRTNLTSAKSFLRSVVVFVLSIIDDHYVLRPFDRTFESCFECHSNPYDFFGKFFRLHISRSHHFCFWSQFVSYVIMICPFQSIFPLGSPYRWLYIKYIRTVYYSTRFDHLPFHFDAQTDETVPDDDTGRKAPPSHPVIVNHFTFDQKHFSLTSCFARNNHLPYFRSHPTIVSQVSCCCTHTHTHPFVSLLYFVAIHSTWNDRLIEIHARCIHSKFNRLYFDTVLNLDLFIFLSSSIFFSNFCTFFLKIVLKL